MSFKVLFPIILLFQGVIFGILVHAGPETNSQSDFLKTIENHYQNAIVSHPSSKVFQLIKWIQSPALIPHEGVIRIIKPKDDYLVWFSFLAFRRDLKKIIITETTIKEAQDYFSGIDQVWKAIEMLHPVLLEKSGLHGVQEFQQLIREKIILTDLNNPTDGYSVFSLTNSMEKEKTPLADLSLVFDFNLRLNSQEIDQTQNLMNLQSYLFFTKPYGIAWLIWVPVFIGNSQFHAKENLFSSFLKFEPNANDPLLQFLPFNKNSNGDCFRRISYPKQEAILLFNDPAVLEKKFEENQKILNCEQNLWSQIGSWIKGKLK